MSPSISFAFSKGLGFVQCQVTHANNPSRPFSHIQPAENRTSVHLSEAKIHENDEISSLTSLAWRDPHTSILSIPTGTQFNSIQCGSHNPTISWSIKFKRRSSDGQEALKSRRFGPCCSRLGRCRSRLEPCGSKLEPCCSRLGPYCRRSGPCCKEL